MLQNMMSTLRFNRGPLYLVAVVLGCLVAPVRAQTVIIDAVSHEYTFGISEPHDAVTREVAFYVGDLTRDAVSREVSFGMPHSQDAVSRELSFGLLYSQDAVSRELSFYFEDPNATQDAVSREFTAYILGTLDLANHFVGAELVTVPQTSIRWMSLAPSPADNRYDWDLYTGVATGLNGNTGDPADDFLYRATRQGNIEQFLAFPEADTDPIGLAFGQSGTAGSKLYVSANNYDGGQPGEVGGAVLSVEPNATVSVFAPLGSGLLDPQGLTERPTSSSSFPQLIYYAQAADPLAVGTIQSDGSPGAWELPTATVGMQNCVRFAPGGTFGNDLYLGGAAGVIYRSDAGGVPTTITPPLGAAVQGLAFSSGYGFGEWLYVLLADGQVVRVAADGTVEPFLSGIAVAENPNLPVRNDLCFTLAGDRLYITDAVRKVIYQIHVELPSGVQDPGPNLPSVSALELVYPNPFNPGTHIRFAVAHPGPVTLRMYNIRGRMVRELVAGESLPAGIHDLYWDGRDSFGRNVASGVYLVRFDGDGETSVKKITLVK